MSLVKKLFSLALFAVICSTVSAEPWTTFGPKRKPVTLVIASNYISPRLLAELIQHESGQPYLMLPGKDDTDKKIYFCPRKRTGSKVIPEAHLNRFINLLGVKRIIVLGNKDYVAQKYVDMLDHNTPVMRIEGNDWYRIAEELNFMLNLSNLDKNFKKFREQLTTEGRLYRPLRSKNPAPAAKAADTAVNAAAEAN